MTQYLPTTLGRRGEGLCVSQGESVKEHTADIKRGLVGTASTAPPVMLAVIIRLSPGTVSQLADGLRYLRRRKRLGELSKKR